MKKETKHVRGILDGLLRKIESGAKKTTAVSEAWIEAADEETKAHARPVCLKNGIMTVAVENSVWMYKLMLEKKEIIRKFNEKYSGRKKATEIRFRVGAAENL